MRTAFASIASKTGFTSPGDALMTLRTSEVAESWSSASSRSRVRRATFVTWLEAKGRQFRAAFVRLLRFGFVVSRCRAFVGVRLIVLRRLT
jgi:hypothetical protein